MPVSLCGCVVDVLMVDDGSLQRCPTGDFQARFTAVRTIRVLRLRRNLGHQRAIAVGLAYAKQNTTSDAVLVMDSDGEDTPQGVVIASFLCERTARPGTFAERTSLPESIGFRFFYHIYRVLHRALTGVRVRVGNFSILPTTFLTTMVAMSGAVELPRRGRLPLLETLGAGSAPRWTTVSARYRCLAISWCPAAGRLSFCCARNHGGRWRFASCHEEYWLVIGTTGAAIITTRPHPVLPAPRGRTMWTSIRMSDFKYVLELFDSTATGTMTSDGHCDVLEPGRGPSRLL